MGGDGNPVIGKLYTRFLPPKMIVNPMKPLQWCLREQLLA